MAEKPSFTNSPPHQPLSLGLVQVFTGDGRGKTTAAIGTAVRAAGRGLRVYICYFMNGNYDSGEHDVLHRLPNVHWAAFGPGLVRHPEKPTPQQKERARVALASAGKVITGGDYDLVILDEINMVISWGWLEVAEVIKIIKGRPPGVELILTGRNADPRLIELADLVTEMVKIKHPFDKGIPARKGIEY